MLRDWVHESICSHRIKMANITPDRFSPSHLGVLCSCQCKYTHEQDWEKITEHCTRYTSVGISETNLFTKVFGRLSITTSHITELYANYNKENCICIWWICETMVVTNKRQMIEWIPVLSTNSIFIQCISLRDPYGSAFLKIFIPKHYEESSEPCFKKKHPLGESILNLRWTESI